MGAFCGVPISAIWFGTTPLDFGGPPFLRAVTHQAHGRLYGGALNSNTIGVDQKSGKDGGCC